MEHPLSQLKQVQLFDENNGAIHHSFYSALTYQDIFIRYLDQETDGEKGILHIYPTDLKKHVLLGGKDTRLPQLKEGLNYLTHHDYQPIVRPHGGLAVVNDLGIVNFSLVLNGHQQRSIDEAYQQMAMIIQELFHPYGLKVETYEVKDSYCPGKYDLVVNGQKIGGSAQRRFKNGVTTAVYLSLFGDQAYRANLIRQFYTVGGADETYPTVNPNVMTTISDLLGQPYRTDHFMNDLTQLFQKHTNLISGDFSEHELENLYQTYLPRIKARTRRIYDDLS